MSTIIDMVKTELEVARARRNRFTQGSSDWDRYNPYVQTLKGLQAALELPAVDCKVVNGLIKEVRNERGRHQETSDRYKTVNALVQALKEICQNAKPAKSPKQAEPAPVPEAPKTDDKPKVVVVLPPYPNISSAVGFVREKLVFGHGVHLEPVFCHMSSPGELQSKMWKGACSKGHKPVLLLDPKPVPMLSSTVEHAEAANKLIEAANQQEQPGSQAWNFRHYLPKLINDVYFLAGSEERKVFDRIVDVVKAFLLPQGARDWKTLGHAKYKKDLNPLWQGFNVTDQETGVFTIPQYFRHLFCGGVDRKEIQERIGWWIAKTKAVEEAHKKATEKPYEVRPFTIAGRPAGFVSVGDYWDSRGFYWQWVGSGVLALAVIRNAKGHVVIMPSPKRRPVDLTRLHKRLEADESDRWFLFTPHKGARQILMNGGFRYDATKTTHKRSAELTRLIQKYVDFGK